MRLQQSYRAGRRNAARAAMQVAKPGVRRRNVLVNWRNLGITDAANHKANLGQRREQVQRATKELAAYMATRLNATASEKIAFLRDFYLREPQTRRVYRVIQGLTA